MTLNFLRQSTFIQKVSAWEYFAGPFQYDATPLGHLGMNIIIHKKASRRHSWGFRGKDGWSVGVAMDYYRCQKMFPRIPRQRWYLIPLNSGIIKLTCLQWNQKTQCYMGCSNSRQHSKTHQHPQKMYNFKPLRASRIKLSTGQGIQKHLWPRLAYHVAPCQQRGIDLQGYQQQNQGRRWLQGWTSSPPPRVQPISTEDIPSNHHRISQRLRSQSGPNPLEPATTTEQLVAHRTRYRTTQQTVRVQPVLAAQRKHPEKSLIYGAPQNLKNIQQC